MYAIEMTVDGSKEAIGSDLSRRGAALGVVSLKIMCTLFPYIPYLALPDAEYDGEMKG